METKICPYCAEKINEKAIKCKHCKSFLDGRDEKTNIITDEEILRKKIIEETKIREKYKNQDPDYRKKKGEFNLVIAILKIPIFLILLAFCTYVGFAIGMNTNNGVGFILFTVGGFVGAFVIWNLLIKAFQDK